MVKIIVLKVGKMTAMKGYQYSNYLTIGKRGFTISGLEITCLKQV